MKGMSKCYGIPNWYVKQLGNRKLKRRTRDEVRKKKGLPRFLSRNDIQMMIKKAGEKYNQKDITVDSIYDGDSTLRNQLIISMLFYTGIRNTELRNINIDQIDFETGFCKVLGKGKKDRYILIPKFLLEDIKKYIGTRKQGKLILGGRGFINAISKRHIARIVKNSAKECNIRNYQEIHPHTLRHSYATYLRNKGIALDEIKELLGHENISTTLIYSRLAMKEVFEKVAGIF